MHASLHSVSNMLPLLFPLSPLLHLYCCCCFLCVFHAYEILTNITFIIPFHCVPPTNKHIVMCEYIIGCIHYADPKLNYLAPSCNTDANCPAYAYCYIVWWKLHDIVGPGLFLRVEQDDTFFNVASSEFTKCTDSISETQDEVDLFLSIL